MPVAPHVGPPVAVPLDGAPFWIGAAHDAGLPLFLPGVSGRQAALVARGDGPWLMPQRAAGGLVRRNGAPLAEGARVEHGDVLEFAPGVAYRVELRAPAARPPAAIRFEPPPPPPPPPAPPSWTVRLRHAWQRVRRRPRRRVSLLGWTLGVLALALLLVAGGLLVRAMRQDAPEIPPPLTEAQAAAYDTLAARVADHAERGAALLDVGLPDAALREFGQAVTTLESSALRDNPWVRPHVDALEAGIAAIYRERRVPVPARYASSPSRGRARGARPPALAGLARTPRLTAAEFAERLATVQRAFAERYGRPLEVTGRDHAEHLALYGAGSAVDLRVRDLSREQVAFAVEQLRAAGVRVKDFSTDAVLRAQVAAAIRAGHADRAGTGLHLHADRFVDRRDPWTVR